MAQFPDFASSEVATATKLDQIGLDYVQKTADESVTSSTTLQNDDHLLYTVATTGTYVFDMYLLGTSAANAAGDLAVAVTFPTGTMYLAGQGLVPTLASGSAEQIQAGGTVYTSGAAFNSYGLSTSVSLLHLHGLLVATATGTIRLQWAQQSSNANASTLKTGSHMITYQVA